jgi:hypothetical protein
MLRRLQITVCRRCIVERKDFVDDRLEPADPNALSTLSRTASAQAYPTQPVRYHGRRIPADPDV